MQPSKIKNLMVERKFWIVMIGLANLLIYRNLIWNDPALAFDDLSVLEPLYKVLSLSNYIHNFLLGKFVDIQPIRDISLLIDMRLIRSLLFWSFHLTNVLLWCLTVCVFCLIAELLYEKRHLIWGVGLLISVHPVTAVSVSWIAARKHLLSVFFISLATLILVRSIKKNCRSTQAALGIPFFYLMAMLSQPIGLLWPAWAVLYAWVSVQKTERFKAVVRLCFSSLALMFVFAALNYYYYTHQYIQYFGEQKILRSFDIASAFLALGRYFYNLIIPLHVTVTYYPGAVQNVVGLAVMPIFIWLCLKYTDLKTFIIWIALLLFPLVIVIGRQANVFIADTYLLIPLLGYFILFLSLVQRFKFQRQPKFKIALGGVLFIVFASISISIAQSFRSLEKVWKRAQSIEETPFVLSQLALIDLSKKDYIEAFELANRFYNWNPSHPLVGLVLSKAVYAYPLWSPQVKINFLEQNKIEDPWYFYSLSALYAETGNFKKAYELLSSQTSKAALYEQSAEKIAAELVYFCVRAHEDGCRPIEVEFERSCEKRVPPWNRDFFIKRLQELNVQMNEGL